jgi:hypothetical protein
MVLMKIPCFELVGSYFTGGFEELNEVGIVGKI